MTTKAKEEANRMIQEYINIINESDFHIPKFISGVSPSSKKYEKVLEEETFELAKQCAINSVNHIINNIMPKSGLFSTSYKEFLMSSHIIENICFWCNVKILLEESSYEH